jgi:hypothetical protein
VFLKLKQIGGNVLPPYEEHFDGVAMTPEPSALVSRSWKCLETRP